MTEQRYDPKALALELGLSEEDAGLMAEVNASAANIRRLAESKIAKGVIVDPKAKPVTKPLEDSKARLSEAVAKAKAEAELRARAETEAEAAERPVYEGADEPPESLTDEEMAAMAAEVVDEVTPDEEGLADPPSGTPFVSIRKTGKASKKKRV